jgi:hypothetical protein
MKYDEESHNQNRSIARGIRAIGGIGLSTSKRYLIIESLLNLLKRIASHIHNNEAKANQINTLLILKRMSRRISLFTTE